MPNLSSRRPVEIFSWVCASTSGLTRSAVGRAPAEFAGDAIELLAAPDSDSTLICRTPASSAARISSALLPTPEKTIRSAGTPAASAVASSPPETTSAPAPRRANVAMTAMLPFALTA